MSNAEPESIMEYLSTDDPQWKQKTLDLAKKRCQFDVHNVNGKDDTTFSNELAREHSYSLSIQFNHNSLGRAEFRPI